MGPAQLVLKYNLFSYYQNRDLEKGKQTQHYIETSGLKAKETKKCHHRQLIQSSFAIYDELV
jgi:hypothetical protein